MKLTSRIGRRSRGSRRERESLRLSIFVSLFGVLALATVYKPATRFLSPYFERTVGIPNQNNLEEQGSLGHSVNLYSQHHATRFLSSSIAAQAISEEDLQISVKCTKDHGDFCLLERSCFGNEDVEGACCLAASPEEVNKSSVCITSGKDVCPFKDLCVAELVPASDVGAECLQPFELEGGVALHLFLLLYLFLALAIVCDDYFSYSLDSLGDLLGMSSDVKGATFAAIGSSAPELFVSLADNVISNPPKSVGVGTIVGSAIFNILIIIGLSGVWAGFREKKIMKRANELLKKGKIDEKQFADRKKKSVLVLDWRPLARDSLFYTVSIAALVGVALTGNEAEFYEGLILLALYAGYLVFMKYNQRIFAAVDKKLGLNQPESKEKATGMEVGLNSDETEGKDLAAVVSKEVETLNELEKRVSGKVMTPSSSKSLRTGFSGATRSERSTKKRRSSVAANIARASFEAFDESDMKDIPYFENLYWPMYYPNAKKQKNDDDDEKLMDKDEERDPEEGEGGDKKNENENQESTVQLSFVQRAFGGGRKMWMLRAYFILVFPINFVFRFTIPDARYDLFGEDKGTITNERKYAYWTEFTMCVVHIAALSHFLVFSAAKFGCLVNIPPSVMGLTVLAAGTSVPDAITSIILTKNGEGDAAVANSIGSNVFDILIGLGLPWFLAGVIFGGAAIATGDIAISIIFLFGVLVVLLVALYFTKFRLNNILGIFLCALYGLYVIFELFVRRNI